MEHASLPKELRFTLDDDAENLFAKLDYALRDGVHIQRSTDPDLFRFLSNDQNEDSLRAYYEKYLRVKLQRRTQGGESYYFLDFMADHRGNLGDHYERLENHLLLIGFLLHKVMILDRNVELRSIAEFKRILRENYPDLRIHINRLIARSPRQTDNPEDNSTIDNAVKSAFERFKQLKWVDYDGDTVETLPAFSRLTDAYAPHIQNIDNYLK
jgi:hypothetical protein